MENRQLLDILHTVARLKDTPRHCRTPGGAVESVAEHSWRLALMAFLIRDEFPQADMDRVIRMCLIHDLGEAFTGDIPAFLKTKADEEAEERLLQEWVDTFPSALRKEMHALTAEMNAGKTLEARITRALDNLEAVISHNESEIGSWEDHEYALNLTYGNERVAFSPYLTELRAEIRRETEYKIETEGRKPPETKKHTEE